MKTYSPRKKAHHPRVPAFVPAASRTRTDGWTAERQARFLAALAITRSVAAAARAAGMARETAYRLRRKPGAESFAEAWDRVLGREPGKRKVTPEERARRAIEGLLKPHIYRGRFTGTGRRADNSALLGHLAMLDRSREHRPEESGRSHGFAARPAVHEPPLPRRPADPISGARRTSFAPERQGPR